MDGEADPAEIGRRWPHKAIPAGSAWGAPSSFVPVVSPQPIW